MSSHFKIKPLCDIFGENTIWNLLYVHVLFASTLGWGVFIIGNIYFTATGGSVTEFLILNSVSAGFAMWTADFLFKIHTYKNNKK